MQHMPKMFAFNFFAALCFAALLHNGCRQSSHAPANDPSHVTAVNNVVDFNVHTHRIRLSWTTETETECFGYYVYRSNSETETPLCLNVRKPLLGAGTTTVPNKYVYYDLDVQPDQSYYYKVQQVDNDGTKQWLIGGDGPVPAKAKPLSPEEKSEITEYGTQFQHNALRSQGEK